MYENISKLLKDREQRTLTTENILNKISDYQIFSYYLGSNFTINKVFSSPFRTDRTPSFCILYIPGRYRTSRIRSSCSCTMFSRKRRRVPSRFQVSNRYNHDKSEDTSELRQTYSRFRYQRSGRIPI